jgi:hypothetical protein
VAPLIVLFSAWLAFRIAGAAAFHAADSSVDSLRLALAVMFFFTAASHFVHRTRADMIWMVPPALGHAAFLVSTR